MTETPPSHHKTLVVITGGTIDAKYSFQKGTPHDVPVEKISQALTGEEKLAEVQRVSAIPELLQRLGREGECDIMPVCMEDSKGVRPTHLDTVLYKLAHEGYDRCVIVHGTDTMPVRARYVQRCVQEYGGECGMDQKRIIFTGAMRPLRNEAGDFHPRETVDGWDNVARALDDAKDETLAPGVYIEMGEGPKRPERMRKDVKLNEDGVTVDWSRMIEDDDEPQKHTGWSGRP